MGGKNLWEDRVILDAGQEDGCNIVLECQTLNSPDFNVLDLAFFHSIQALQHQQAPRTIDELVGGVQATFEELDRVTLDNVFLSLQKCIECAMLDKGGNAYTLPPMSK